MSEKPQQPRPESDEQLEREIRADRKFTLSEAIGRLAGPGSMKGASPVARKQQAESEIETWLRQHLTDAGGGLLPVILRRVSASQHLLDNLDQPLVVLSACCKGVLDSEFLLADVVREADVEWGRIFDERPRFEKDGSPAQSEDPYTLESVRAVLSGMVAKLGGEAPSR